MEETKQYQCIFCGGKFSDTEKDMHLCPYCETSFPEKQLSDEAQPRADSSEQIQDELVEFEKKTKQKPTGFLYEIYTLLHDMVYILAAVTFIFVFAFRLVGVDGDSMFRTLHNKDFLVVQNNLFCSDYQYGDIVIASVPTFKNGEPIVKRVIATAGQQVDIRYDAAGIGTVYVDNVPLEENYINEAMWNIGGTTSVLVPEDCVFLMGDNRNRSTDSRSIGCVNTKYLIGKVLVIALPGDNSDGRHSGGAREWDRIGTVS